MCGVFAAGLCTIYAFWGSPSFRARHVTPVCSPPQCAPLGHFFAITLSMSVSETARTLYQRGLVPYRAPLEPHVYEAGFYQAMIQLWADLEHRVALKVITCPSPVAYRALTFSQSRPSDRCRFWVLNDLTMSSSELTLSTSRIMTVGSRISGLATFKSAPRILSRSSIF
ncbi:hypothetical protein EVAR_51199_1 [Eumeta japonica]|uniref:Uncharacterized protein n=1 Tax=Eumeta variegata TaxID=151549 RepID=A0A4C1ZBH7_EUMVA|nr:hypothetical protein EVAR_51199_1 [Eumeta japonica]